MGTRRLLSVLAVCVALCTAAGETREGASPAMTFTYYDGQVELGHIKRFHWAVLEEALERTRGAFGDYRLVALPPAPGRRQRYDLLQGHPITSVAVFNSASENARGLVPVRIPVDRGLLSYRILLIRSDDQARFDQVQSVDDLKTVRFGFLSWWSEVEIMKAAGAPVVTGDNYDGLYRMLSARRFDAFSRGVSEIQADLERGEQFVPGLAIEKHLLLHYPLPVYFWFPDNPDGRLRAERVRVGLASMIADGSLQAMLDKRYGAEFTALDLAGRRVIEVPNNFLDGKDPLDDARLWFRP